MDKAAARFFEYAGRAEFEFRIVAQHPEERGAGFERGFEILAVRRRGVIVEKFLERRAAEPGPDKGSYRHGDRPARDQDNAGDRQRGDVFELVRKPGGDKFARLPLGGGERLVRGQDRQILVPEAGGEERRPRPPEMRAVGKRGHRLAHHREGFCGLRHRDAPFARFNLLYDNVWKLWAQPAFSAMAAMHGSWGDLN